MSPRPARWIVATLVAAALLPSSARAESFSLVTNTNVAVNGGLFYQTNQQPTGTGVIDPFLTIQRNGTEEGYNTDGAFQFDEKRTHYTNALPLNTLEATTIGTGSTQYYKFLLDINETATDTGRLLSINEIQLYLGNTPNPTGFTGSGFAVPSTLVYDLDGKGTKNDNTIELDYKLNSGSGSGDMYMYIPKSLFDSAFADTGYQYVYLYSKFGSPNGSDAGFEEWAASKKDTGGGNNNAVPAPPGIVLAGVGLGCMLLRRLRRDKAAPQS